MESPSELGHLVQERVEGFRSMQLAFETLTTPTEPASFLSELLLGDPNSNPLFYDEPFLAAEVRPSGRSKTTWE